MAPFGCHELRRTGPRIITGIGPGLSLGAGHGSTKLPGDSRPATTVAGSTTANPGPGFLGRSPSVRSTPPRWWRGSAEVTWVWAWPLAEPRLWAGSHLAMVNRTSL